MVEGQFMVWAPDDGDEEDADMVEGETPSHVAEIWLQDHYADLDCPGEQEVHVRSHDGKLTKLIVDVEEVLTYHAREVP